MRGKAPLPTPDTPVRVVVITLDNHLSGAFARAQAQFARAGTGVHIDFHAAADWDEKPGTLDAALANIARGDIILCTMLFLEDHIRAVMPALEARRDDCDAIVGLMSAGEVVKLTRMGDYRMDKPATGMMGNGCHHNVSFWRDDVNILAEPGRFMVGNAGVLLTRVEYVKPTDARNFLVVDAAMNDLIRPPLYQAYHEVVPVAASAS